MALQDLIDGWLSHIGFIGLARNTLLSYRSDLLIFLRFLSHYNQCEILSIEEIKAVDIRTLRSFLAFRKQNGYKTASNRRVIACLRNFFEYARKNMIFDNSSLDMLQTTKIPESLPKSLSQEEISVALDSIGVDDCEWVRCRDIAILTLMYVTGMRISEALSVKARDITQLRQTSFINVIGKGNKARSIPVLPIALERIENYLAILPFALSDGDPIFRAKKGAVILRSNFTIKLSKIKLSNNLPDFFCSHAFRHSFATRLLEQDVDLRVIQQIMGHSSLSSTQKYTKVTNSRLANSYASAHPLSTS